jgi:endonuclease-3
MDNPFAAFAYKSERTSDVKNEVKREEWGAKKRPLEAAGSGRVEQDAKRLRPLFSPSSPSSKDFVDGCPKVEIVDEEKRANRNKLFVEQLGTIHTYRKQRLGRATVDDFHEYLVEKAKTDDSIFHAIVAGVLGTQTRDVVALATSKKFEARFPTINTAEEASLADIEDIVKNVNFKNNKAKYIKGIAGSIKNDFLGVCPSEFRDLVKLPGVGPKIAHLIRSVVFQIDDSGVVVDSNVYRVAKRIGWGLEKDNAMQLSRKLSHWWPKGTWAKSTQDVVGFGQLVCTPKKPKCNFCPIRDDCTYAIRKRFG